MRARVSWPGYREELAKAVAAMPAEKSGGYRAEIALIDAGDKLAPTEVITSGGERTLAGRRLLLGLEKNAATEGDVWMLDRASGTFDDRRPRDAARAFPRHRESGRLGRGARPPGEGRCEAGGARPRRADAAIGPRNTYRKAFRQLLACAKSKRESKECSDEWFKAIGDLGRAPIPRSRNRR